MPEMLAPGTVVEGLRLDRVLGQGSFSTSYLATDEATGQSFVLKATGGDPERLKKLQAQAQQLTTIEHPNLARIIKWFKHDESVWLLMPYYRGQPLHHLLEKSGTFTVDETLALARPLAAALDTMHDTGIVHSDVKPANIYVTEDGTPILLDLCNAEVAVASDGYAAPEQYQADRNLSASTDSYGLAATLYRCVTGRIPPSATARQQAISSGQGDPLDILTQLDNSELAPIAPALMAGLKLDGSARPQRLSDWPFPGTTARAAALSTAPVEREGREWLPMILLALFALVLFTAIAWLFLDDDFGSKTPQAVEKSEPSEVTAPRPRGMVEETRRWEAALGADTVFAYRLFLEDFPESSRREQAEMHLERLDHQAWGAASLENSKASIEAYLENFPDGLHQADALIALDQIQQAEEDALREEQATDERDRLAWESTRRKRSLQAIEDYLANWPNGDYVEQARELQTQLQREASDRQAFQAAQKLNTLDAYETYVNAYPQGVMVARALQAIDDLTLRPGKVFKDCASCPSMVVVPAGSFWQGSRKDAPMALKMEMPRRTITIAEPFAVSAFEITMEQWDLCVSEGACSTRPNDNGWGRGNRPVIMVSWNDTQEYTSWLSQKTGQSYSLPSESQWEYVARAGEESDWLGGDPAAVCEYGNIAAEESGFRWQHPGCADSAAIETLPVGSLRPNAFGLHDVIGNVAEWTNDCMNLSYLDAPTDGTAWGRGICSSRITRGGSWFTGTREVRLPARFNLKNGDRNDFTGFRVVRKVEPQ